MTLTATRPAVALRALHWAPPIARRMLRTALAGALAVAPPPPVTLHAGGDGHLVTGPEPVRVHPSTTTTTTPAPKPHAPRRRVPRATERIYLVRAGDNLWVIARSEVARVTGRRPDDGAIAAYWQRVIAANRATIRSGDPSLIFPGELIVLPAY